MAELTLKLLTKPDEMAAVVALQQVYWGDDMNNIVPAHMLLNFAKHGGHVIGAYDDDYLTGAAMGYPGTTILLDAAQPAKDGLAIMSKRAVVLPEYRSHGVGEKLKAMQYSIAKKQQIQLIRWTFDPLLARNAYFNIFKLGAVVQHYEANYFGEISSHPTLQEDRLVADWWVGHPRSEAHLQRLVAKPDYATLIAAGNALVVQGTFTGNLLSPPENVSTVDGEQVILLELPFDFVALNSEDHKLGAGWRKFLATALQTYFRAGYIITNFVREGERVFYLLTPDTGTFGFGKY